MTERHVKWNKCSRLIEEVDQLDVHYQNQPSATNEAKLEAKLDEVRKMIAPCEELSATVRACLRASRRPWALLLLEEAIDIDFICADYIVPKEVEEEEAP